MAGLTLDGAFSMRTGRGGADFSLRTGFNRSFRKIGGAECPAQAESLPHHATAPPRRP